MSKIISFLKHLKFFHKYQITGIKKNIILWFKKNKTKYFSQNSASSNQSNLQNQSLRTSSQNYLQNIYPSCFLKSNKCNEESRSSLFIQQNLNSDHLDLTNESNEEANISSYGKIIVQQELDFIIDKESKEAYIIGNECINSEIFIPQFITYEKENYVVSKIMQGSFKDTKVQSILIPHDSKITTIERDALFNSSIECLYIPESISELNKGWCSNTPNLNKIIISPNNKYFIYFNSSMVLWKSDQNSDIYDTILFVNRNVKYILIPSFIKYISSHSFENSEIENITIPSSIITICERAFNNCENLQNVKFEEDSKLRIIEKEAFPKNLIKNIDFTFDNLFLNELFDSNEFENILEIMQNSKDAIELMICSDNDENDEQNNFEIIDTKSYNKLIEKITNKIFDSSIIDIYSIVRYIEKYLSGNTQLVLFIILNCVANSPIVMMRASSLIRIIYKNHSSVFLSSFCSALKNFRLLNTELNIHILLLIQNLYGSYIFNSYDILEIIPCYLNENEENYIPFLISDKYKIQQKSSTLQSQKENSVLREKLNSLKEKIKKMEYNNTPNIENNLLRDKLNSNEYFSESLELLKQNKYSRRYSNMYKAVSSVAYIFGPKCYDFFRKYFPLPHETSLRSQISPIIKKYVDNLIDINQIKETLNEFLPSTISEEKIHATLAIDAAAFKEVCGETILQKFPTLTTIVPENAYNNLFVFYIQPININIKPFPIHIKLKENGAASKEIVACIKQIISIIEKNGIVIDYVATDGDHQYDNMHEQFFELIFELHKSNMPFSEMIKPISDFLHLLKNFRSNLVKYGIEIDHKNMLQLHLICCNHIKWEKQ